MQYNIDIFNSRSFFNILDYPEYYKEALSGYYCCFARGGLNQNLRLYNNAMIIEHRREMLFKKLIDFYNSGKIIDIILEKEFMIGNMYNTGKKIGDIYILSSSKYSILAPSLNCQVKLNEKERNHERV